MKESEALAIIDQLVVAAQKSRSILNEIGLSKELIEHLAPASSSLEVSAVLPILLKISDRGSMTPLDYNNIATLITSNAPEIEAAYVGMGGTLIEPDWDIVSNGWDPE